MSYQTSSPQSKLKEGKRLLRDAYNNPDRMSLALLSIHSALDDYLRSRRRSTPRSSTGYSRQPPLRGNNSLIDILDQLQREHIITLQERGHVLWMRAMRNKVAHSDPRYLVYRNVDQYAQLVEKIISRNSGAQRIGPSPNKRRKHRAQSARQNTDSDRLSSVQPAEAQTTQPPPAPVIAIEASSPPEITPPVPVQKPAATDYSDFLEELLMQGVAADASKKNDIGDNDLLKQLLNQQPI